jgi:GTP-binding protein
VTNQRIDPAVSAEFVTSAARFVDMPSNQLPEVAVVGRSNVGKSSLINALVNRRNLARTSRTPGKTQTVNFYLIDQSFYLVDLPGLGYAKVSRTQREAWGRLIRGYVRQRDALRLVVHLVDSRHELTDLDLEVASIVRENDRRYLVLLTKTDKLNQKQRAASSRRVKETLGSYGLEIPVIATSAVKKRGIDETWDWIEALLRTEGDG